MKTYRWAVAVIAACLVIVFVFASLVAPRQTLAQSPESESLVGLKEFGTSAEKQSKCVLTTGKWADPTDLWLGELTWLTLTTTTRSTTSTCPFDANSQLACVKVPAATRRGVRGVTMICRLTPVCAHEEALSAHPLRLRHFLRIRDL